MGWVRVQTFSISEKHALWNKRFLVLCVGQMYLMKSQEVRKTKTKQSPNNLCHFINSFMNSS